MATTAALAAAANAVAVAANQTPAVEFNSTRVTEMAMQWVKPNGADSLMTYFQQVFPVAERYGVRALGRLLPEEAVVGELLPTVIGMVEWPSLGSFDGFMRDADYQRLYPQRDAALDRLIVTHLQPIEDASVRFDPEMVYELAGLWIRPDGGRERIDAYDAQITPIAVEYGAHSPLRLAGVRSAWGDFLPTEVRLMQWPDQASWQRFREDSRVARLDELRDSALSKFTVTRCRAQAVGH